MQDSNKLRRRVVSLGAGAVIAGSALVGGISVAHAATPTTTPSASASSTAGTSGVDTTTHMRSGLPAHGTAAEEALEKPVTGTNATKAGAAAVKAVGSGTATTVTTDASGNGYEVTVTKSGGSTVEVHLNSSFQLDDHGRLGTNVGDTSAQQGQSSTTAG